MSQTGGSIGEGTIYWQTPLTHGPGIVSRLLDTNWPSGIVININFPPRPPQDVTGIEVTKQGRRDQALLNIDKRNDPWGTPYFWFGFERPPSKIVKGTDLGAIDEGRISITPLMLNLTDDETCEALQAAFPSGGAGKGSRRV